MPGTTRVSMFLCIVLTSLASSTTSMLSSEAANQTTSTPSTSAAILAASKTAPTTSRAAASTKAPTTAAAATPTPTTTHTTTVRDIDECLSNPCTNNGTCHDENDRFTCDCVDGYKGETCSDKDKAEHDEIALGDNCSAETQTCGLIGNATCDVDQGKCVCKSGYSETDDVENKACILKNVTFGGECDDDGPDEQCMTANASCITSSCSCINDTRQYVKERDECVLHIDECLSNPCTNNGTCHDENDRFTCDCVDGYKGETCSDKVALGDNCSAETQTCGLIGNATCDVDQGKCVCKSGYSETDDVENKACILKNVTFGGECDDDGPDEQCMTANASCITSSCSCINDTRQYVKERDECVLLALGDNCSAETQTCGLIGNATCDVDQGKCVCKSGYTETDDEENKACILKNVTFGGECDDDGPDEQCMTANASCITSSCSCINDTRQYVKERDECVLHIDECLSNPCTNNGTCHDENDRFTCDCVDGYKGETCSDKDKAEHDEIALGDNCSAENQTCGLIGNATCDVDQGKCVCKSGYTETDDEENKACILKKINFGDECDDDGPDVQCMTANASCISSSCRCNKTRQYVQGREECVLRPLLPQNASLSFLEIDIEKYRFTASWKGIPLTMQVVLQNTSHGKTQNVTVDKGTQYFTFKGLQSGTAYSICLYVKEDDAISINCTKPEYTYTRPEAVKESNISDINQNNFTVSWNSLSMCDYYKIEIRQEPRNGNISFNISRTTNVTSNIFTNLTAGTNYTITIIAVAGQFNSAPYTIHSITRPPKLSNATVSEQHNSSFILAVNYTGPQNKFVRYCTEIPVHLLAAVSEETPFCYNSPSEGNKIVKCSINSTFSISGLNAGTNYTLYIYTCIQGLKSEHPYLVENMTRPINQVSVEIVAWGETSLEVQWSVKNENASENILITVTNESSISPIKNDLFDRNGSTFNTRSYIGLEAGTKYNILAYSVINSLRSDTAASVSSYTRPTPPKTANISHIEENSFKIDFDDRIWKYYSFIITPAISPQNNFSNITVPVSDLPSNITGLESGSLYSVHIYSIVAGISSEHFRNISSFTKPGQVNDIVGVPDNSTTSELQVKWNKPTGFSSYFQYYATCISPNNGSLSPLSETTAETNVLLSPLDPGTFCSITVVAFIINVESEEKLEGRPRFTNITTGTKEAAPGKVKDLNTSSLTYNSVRVTWNSPDVKNGIIRRYDATVLQNGNCSSKTIFRCNHTECGTEPKVFEESGNGQCNDSKISNQTYEKDEESFYWDVNGLHAFRNYSIEIVAYTISAGAKGMVAIETLEHTPGKPLSLSMKNRTSTTIDIIWQPPSEKNGIVKNYTVEYTYASNNCYKSGVSVSKNVSSTEEPLNEIQLSGPDIYPFWTYTITVFATNEIASGKRSSEIEVTTLESKPGKIKEGKVSVAKPTAFNVNVSWSTPCDINGQLLLYYLCLTNESCTDHGLPKCEECYNTTNTNVESELTIFPYRNYSFTVSAVNSAGSGDQSEAVRIESEAAPPERPTKLEVNAEASDTIRAVWNKPSQFYGPVYYFVEAIDVEDPKLVKKSPNTTTAYWTDSLVNTSSISGLDAYWEYNITVYAVTVTKNIAESRASPSKLIRTKEAKPGPVSFVSIVSESDVKKNRSLSINWEAPAERDLNGILTNYWIFCTKSGERCDPFINDTNTSATITSFKFTNIPPGNYKFTVVAENSAGKGITLSNTTLLKAGAPYKPQETESTLLMKQSTVKVSDGERQISVQLPLHDLLCNPSGGQPDFWGVVVVQDGNQDDEPFRGARQEFETQRLSVYKRWSQVKDDDSIPAYVATPKSWRPRCSSQLTGNRQKRSAYTETPYEDFVVGSQGECSGVPGDENCNGELQPGRKYRVKSFVCTSEGCTETRYSKPISTEPDLTVPIAAGTSSAIVVLAVVFVVIFILRRKQLVCFAKDPERSTRTHRPGSDIQLDKIETPKKNAFRPGPIKLSDFPDAVEKMHRDSDLLFADAYKLLKEKCPNHPMTAAEQQCCRPKNRYTNILPFDHSRVKLRPSDDIEGSDYINANYIPGYTSRREYIATQGAMQATFDDFWRMVWEQNVDTIVMLTKLMEKGRHKCDKYWPDLGEPVFYGDLVVSLQSESNLSDYTIKIFEVKMKEERKMVRHFSYLKWPDMGCPETPELLLEFVKAVKQYTNREKTTSSGPTIVHCSAGVGRTGTFIAVDHLLQHIRDHDEVDIFNLVLEMRNHRLNMVQTEDQYVYIHECLKAFITTDEEDEDEEDEHVYVNTSFGAQEENIYVNSGFEKE